MSRTPTAARYSRRALGALAALAAAVAMSPPTALAQDYYGDDDRYYDSGSDGDYDSRYYDRTDNSGGSDYDEQDAPDVSFFYNELADDGRWISHRDYGYVWMPRNVDDEWRPYTRGSWTYTNDHGWYWVSDEPFGWATYHYGRWAFDDSYGWMWVPGTTWGPAWVAWRSNDDYLGWAPLPPDAYWDTRSGLRYDANFYESPRYAAYWSFVEPRYITTASVYRYCAPRHRARTIIYSTRPQTNYAYVNTNIFNTGISISFVERRLGAPVARTRIYATESRQARGFDRRAGDTVRSWRPDFRRRDKWVKRETAVNLPARGFWRNVDRPARQVRAPSPGNLRPTFRGPGDFRWEQDQPAASTRRPPVAPQAAPARQRPGFSLERDRTFNPGKGEPRPRGYGRYDQDEAPARANPNLNAPARNDRAVRNFDRAPEKNPPAVNAPRGRRERPNDPPPFREAAPEALPDDTPPPPAKKLKRQAAPAAPAAPATNAAPGLETVGPGFGGHGQPRRNAYGAPQ